MPRSRLRDFAGQKKKPAPSEVEVAAGDDEGGSGWRISFAAGTCSKAEEEAAALLAPYVSIRQHTSAYDSILQHVPDKAIDVDGLEHR